MFAQVFKVGNGNNQWSKPFPTKGKGSGKTGAKTVPPARDWPSAHPNTLTQRRLFEEFKDRLADLPDDQRDALQSYTDELEAFNYEVLNSTLRSGKNSVSTATKEQVMARVEVMDAAFAHDLGTSVKSYRGLGRRPSTALVEAMNNKQEIVGMVVQDPGYMSTSLDPDMGVGFSKLVNINGKDGYAMLEIGIDETKKGLYLEPITKVSDEHELLLPRNSQVVITGYRFQAANPDAGFGRVANARHVFTGVLV